jgi:hypothetical protein
MGLERAAPLVPARAARARRGVVRAPALGRLAALLALCAAPCAAPALAPFQFEKPEDLTRSDWSWNVQAGVGLSGGNTPSSSVTGEASVARRSRRNRLQVGGSVALARARVTVAQDTDGVPGVGPGELREERRTTREAWAVRGRYDLFATKRSSAYLAAIGGGDRPAGKALVLSTQVGFGADVLRRGAHVLRLEAGYDLSREEPVTGPVLEIHSARLFLGHALAIDERLTLTTEAEALTNLNQERSGAARIARLEDTRLLGRIVGTYRINGSLSLAARFTATYDAAPPARPPPPGTSFQAGFTPLAERLDTTADLLLVASF